MASVAESSSAPAAGSVVSPASPSLPVADPRKSKMDTSSLPPRTLVLCFDGTANQYDGTNTNVVKFYSLLKKDITDEQLCYYQPGVGTYIEPGVVSPLFQWCAKIADEAVAWYLDAHVRGGYQFLMQNWRPNDKICIFGFSRGAYTARALAGLVHKIGLLPKDNPEQVPMAYKLFKQTDKDSIQLAAGFKQTFCRDVKIEFVGVWDTVASVGILRGKTLPFTTSNTTIKVFRHALSLDEHRAMFRPNLYHRPPPETAAPQPPVTSRQSEKQPEPTSPLATSPTSFRSPSPTHSIHSTDALKAPDTPQPAVPSFPSRKNSKHAPFAGKSGLQTQASRRGLRRFLRRFPKHAERKLTNLTDPSDGDVGETDVKEVWFAGCHSDVGGGSVSNSTTHCLSDISLRWMVREVVLSQSGIQFDSAALERAGIPESVFQRLVMHARKASHAHEGEVPPAPAFFVHRPSTRRHGRERSEKEMEARASADSGVSVSSAEGADDPATDDALQPIHDELQLDKFWWLLEIIPTEYSWQDGAGLWHHKWGFHCGRGRRIPDDIHPQFHESVKHRMDYAPLKYTPRAVWKTGTETYVS